MKLYDDIKAVYVDGVLMDILSLDTTTQDVESLYPNGEDYRIDTYTKGEVDIEDKELIALLHQRGLICT